MLKHLYIKNFTLIDELNIDFFPGFSVITGETGAGKSIIVGAVGLLKVTVPTLKASRRTETSVLLKQHSTSLPTT